MENNGYHHPYLLHHHNRSLHQWTQQQHQQHHQLYDSYFPHHLYHYQQPQQFQQGLIYYEQQPQQQQQQPYLLHQLRLSDQLFQQQQEQQQQQQPYLLHQLQLSDQLFQQQHEQQQQQQPYLLHQLQLSDQLFQQQHEQQQQQQQQQPEQGVIHHGSVQGVLDCIPLGYRFSPTDDELIIHYLRKKVYKLPLPENRIHEDDIYACTPEVLISRYPWDILHKENEWFFFTTLKPRHPNGSRPARACPSKEGFWRLTGSDKGIRYRGSIIGHKKTLDFLLGETPGIKTDWKMHEYRLKEKCPQVQPRIKENRRNSRVVLCRIYLSTKHKDNGNGGAGQETMNENLDHGVITNEAPVPNEDRNLIVSNIPLSGSTSYPCLESIATANSSNSEGDATSSQVFPDIPYCDQSLYDICRQSFNYNPEVASNKNGGP